MRGEDEISLLTMRKFFPSVKLGLLTLAVPFFLVSCTNGANTFGAAPVSGGSIGGGLSGTSADSNAPGAGKGGVLTGMVMGGLSPVAGATVNLMAAGSDTPVASATTASDGGFSFDFTKPTEASLLYVVVSGGNAGGASSKNLQLVSLVGGSSDKIPSNVEVNELTTAAFSEVMFDFGLEKKDEKGVVSFKAPPNGTGISNAAAEWKNMIAVTGKLNTSNANLTKSDQDALAIIANAVAACIQTPTTCDSLFSAASNSGGTAASSILESVENMLTVNADVSPVNKIATPLASSTGFSILPNITLSSLTLPLPATNTTLPAGTSPFALAVDSKGNVWVSGNGTLTKIPSNGKKPSTFTVNGPLYGLAIDSQGNLWTTSTNQVLEISPAGKTVGTFPVGNDPRGLAIDSSGNIWIANQSGNSITELNSSGGAVGNYTLSSGSAPYALSIDSKGNVWVANNSSPGSLTELNSSGSQITTVNTGKNPRSMAIDANGNLWVACSQSDSVSKLSAKGASMGSYIVNSPGAVVIDADGQAWITNNVKNGTVTEIDGASGVTIGSYPVGNAPTGLTLDSSGNLWVVNSADKNISKISKVAVGPGAAPYQGPQFASASF